MSNLQSVLHLWMQEQQTWCDCLYVIGQDYLNSEQL